MKIFTNSFSIYLSSAQTNDEISNESIFSFTTSMANHDTPSGTSSHCASKYWQSKMFSNENSMKKMIYAAIDSETEPIWLTFNKRQSQAFFSMANWIRLTLVTVKSSLKFEKIDNEQTKQWEMKFYPTSWTPRPLTAVKRVWNPFQSSCSKASSIEIIGYFSICFK